MSIDLDNLYECIEEVDNTLGRLADTIYPSIERFGPVKIDGVMQNCSLIKGLKAVVMDGNKATYQDVMFTDDTADTMLGLADSLKELSVTADIAMDRVSEIDDLKEEVSSLETTNEDLEDKLTDMENDKDKAEEAMWEMAAERDNCLDEIKKWRAQSFVLNTKGLTLTAEPKEEEMGKGDNGA